MIQSLKIYGFLWVLVKCVLLSTLGGCLPAAVPSGSNQIPFKSIDRIPMVEGLLNGKRALFILDTGASCSILNEAVSRQYNFKFTGIAAEELVGLNGEARLNQAFHCVVEFGTLKVNAVFRTRHMGALSQVIQDSERLEIAGIIGSDVFKRYRITIDYRNNTITF